MKQTNEKTAKIFEQYRVLLFSIAYRMLGSASDAEDMVQDAFVRWLQADEEEIRTPRAYLTTVVVRLCLDQLRSARVQREVYLGPWLPEPLPTEQQPELMTTVELAESLSFAFLTLLENLSPLERAVFLLREVFDYDYDEIAAIVDKSAANCRQVLHRARQHLGQRHLHSDPRFSVPRPQQERLIERFLRAVTAGDIDQLLNLLTDDVVFTGDGGGKVTAGTRPVRGPTKVARGTLGALVKWFPPDIQPVVEEVNGQLAIVGYVRGQVIGVVMFAYTGERVSRIYAVLNPEKLRRFPDRSLDDRSMTKLDM